jgi:hypothetical protein
MNIKLCPKAFFLKHLYIISFLLFANILGIVATYYFDPVSGLIFLFLSIDTMVSIHESLVFPVRKFFGASGFLYYSWVIPYGVVLVFFIIAYSKFLFQLPKRTSICCQRKP